THLVDELKTLANLESPDFVLQREDLSLPDLIQDVVQAAGPAIRRENISVESGLSGGRPVISGDRVKLHRLLANLCSNALRYAKSRINIDVRQISETPEWIELTVEDDGPGIPEKDREKVFERYYRVDASRNRSSGGSGLGLAICSEIARAHGGSIEAGVSERLGGAELKVKLPVT
ncbi:MAG: hypothetical protein KAJ98_09075, partial [Spirochaetaceae bacterium]|nr:hypothetical protein [Spirochaetaceae bacterium]